MLPKSTFPAALPLSREAALNLLDRLDEFDATGGTFLTFVMIPVEERVGEYRFAGASRSLAEAVRRVEDFADVMMLLKPDRPGGMLRGLLADNTGSGKDGDYEYPRKAPVDVGTKHRLVLCVQYGAPYDDVGVCVVEIATLAGSLYEGLQLATEFPLEWREPLVEWVLEQGSERFGPAPTPIEEAIQNESRREVWSGWPKRLAASGGWEELIAS